MKPKLLLLFVIPVALMSFMTSSSQSNFKVYSGFIYHFTKYTQWPASMQSGDFVIGVIGSEGMNKEMSSLAAQKKVGSRAIKVKSFATASEVERCHILFLPKEKSSDLSAVAAKAKSNNSLLVTESDGAAKNGSIINFIEANGKVRFELNLAAAKAHELKISSDLQRLAILVE